MEGRRQLPQILNGESLAPLAQNNNVVRFGFVDATIRIYELALDSDDHVGLCSDTEEGSASSQCSNDSGMLFSLILRVGRSQKRASNHDGGVKANRFI